MGIKYSGFQANVCKTLLYNRFQAKLCTTFLALAQLICLSACSNGFDFFFKRQKFVFSGLLLPSTLILVAPIGNTSWVCDLRWESYALEQAERLKSHARAKKVVHTFAWNPLYETICLVLRIKIVLSLLLLKTSISATLRVLIDNMIFFSLNDSQKFPPP